jgi:hypothetical protein
MNIWEYMENITKFREELMGGVHDSGIPAYTWQERQPLDFTYRNRKLEVGLFALPVHTLNEKQSSTFHDDGAHVSIATKVQS